MRNCLFRRSRRGRSIRGSVSEQGIARGGPDLAEFTFTASERNDAAAVLTNPRILC